MSKGNKLYKRMAIDSFILESVIISLVYPLYPSSITAIAILLYCIFVIASFILAMILKNKVVRTIYCGSLLTCNVFSMIGSIKIVVNAGEFSIGMTGVGLILLASLALVCGTVGLVVGLIVRKEEMVRVHDSYSGYQDIDVNQKKEQSIASSNKFYKTFSIITFIIVTCGIITSFGTGLLYYLIGYSIYMIITMQLFVVQFIFKKKILRISYAASCFLSAGGSLAAGIVGICAGYNEALSIICTSLSGVAILFSIACTILAAVIKTPSKKNKKAVNNTINDNVSNNEINNDNNESFSLDAALQKSDEDLMIDEVTNILLHLKKLYDAGILTEEEFNEKKKRYTDLL